MQKEEIRLQAPDGSWWGGVMGWQQRKEYADAFGSYGSANKTKEWLEEQGIHGLTFVVNRYDHLRKKQPCDACGSTNTYIDGYETIGCWSCGNLSDRRGV